MKIHVVRKGDTLYEISQKYGVDMDVLLAANPQIEDPDVLMIGQKIRIPSKGVAETPARDRVMDSKTLMETHTSVQEAMTDADDGGEGRAIETSAEFREAGPFFGQWDEGTAEIEKERWTRGGHVIHYTVKPGDTLWEIAHRYGISLHDLIAANPQIENPDQINVGDVIRIPRPGYPVPPHYPYYDHGPIGHPLPYYPYYHYLMPPYMHMHHYPWGFGGAMVPPRGEKAFENAAPYKKKTYPQQQAGPWTPFTVWVPYEYSGYLYDHYGYSYQHHCYPEAPFGIYKHDGPHTCWDDKACDGYSYPYHHQKKMYRGEEEIQEPNES